MGKLANQERASALPDEGAKLRDRLGVITEPQLFCTVGHCAGNRAQSSGRRQDARVLQARPNQALQHCRSRVVECERNRRGGPR